jgi:NAD(P)-dependent dehydrogenase (short-subunit alcohol dehydrogenase family)
VALAEAGALVTIVARTRVDAVVEVLAGAGLAVEGVALDVTDTGRVAAFVAGAPPFDILVNNAGAARHAHVLEITEADYDAVLALNLRAVLFVSQAVARRLVGAGRPGSIINISSQMGHVGGANRAVYAASKFGVEGLTRAMAIDLAAKGIRVNTICPTFIETELSARSLADPSFRSWVLSKIKLGRLGRLEDIMGPVVLLASDAAQLMTGSSLVVDGGWIAG